MLCWKHNHHTDQWIARKMVIAVISQHEIAIWSQWKNIQRHLVSKTHHTSMVGKCLLLLCLSTGKCLLLWLTLLCPKKVHGDVEHSALILHCKPQSGCLPAPTLVKQPWKPCANIIIAVKILMVASKSTSSKRTIPGYESRESFFH